MSEHRTALVALAVLLAGGAIVATQVVPGSADTPTRTGVHVARVIDGDTIVVDIDGGQRSVRIIGIDTPETTKGKHECQGAEATARTRELVDGQDVTLVADPSQTDTDRYDRLLRYVSTPAGTDVGLDLIERGLAHEYTFRTAYEQQEQYRAAQEQAKAERVGGWNVCAW